MELGSWAALVEGSLHSEKCNVKGSRADGSIAHTRGLRNTDIATRPTSRYVHCLGNTGAAAVMKRRRAHAQLFDPDLINLPPNHCLPLWWNDGEDEDVDDGWVEQDPPPKEKKKKKDKGEGGEKDKDKEKKEEKKEEERTEERKEDEKREKKQEERILRAEEREEAEAGLVNGIEAAAAAASEAARPNGGAAHPGGIDGGVG